MEHWASRHRFSRSQAIRHLLFVSGGMAHPAPPSPPGNQGGVAFLRIDQGLLRTITKWAGLWGVSRSETIRMLLWAVAEPILAEMSTTVVDAHLGR